MFGLDAWHGAEQTCLDLGPVCTPDNQSVVAPSAGTGPTISSTVNPSRTIFQPLLSLLLIAVGAGVSVAQLRPDEVLVVYDSRIQDSGGVRTSREVAEYYAGSAKVPGGVGGMPGVRPGVRVFDLSSAGLPVRGTPNITYTAFNTDLRAPLQTFLTTSRLTTRIRCIVLTKGMPHRILDTDAGDIMDFPGSIGPEYSAGDITAASVDTEMVLLWQTLNTGETGGNSDSRADGCIINPYWKSAASITSFTNANIEVSKSFGISSAAGPVYATNAAAGTVQRLTSGDLYLVTRLDGDTVADVRAAIDRAQNIFIDVNTTALLLDESESNGVADFGPNGELDNSNANLSGLYDSDDYESSRDLFLNDRRWLSTMVRYNALSGFNQFFIGPRLAWMANHGIAVSDPVALVASYGFNHVGQPLTAAGRTGGEVYATSYNYVPGAIFSSLESFNCRGFGGLAPLSFSPQQQASAFIAAGGTLAVGNVWEPLAASVPDIKYLSQNFLLGNLSFAEAAWTSIPALSWMQIAVGDPLARVQRSSEDIDANRRVNIDDLYAWERTPADVNRNGTADASDRSFVLRALRAAERTNVFTPR